MKKTKLFLPVLSIFIYLLGCTPEDDSQVIEPSSNTSLNAKPQRSNNSSARVPESGVGALKGDPATLTSTQKQHFETQLAKISPTFKSGGTYQSVESFKWATVVWRFNDSETMILPSSSPFPLGFHTVSAAIHITGLNSTTKKLITDKKIKFQVSCVEVNKNDGKRELKIIDVPATLNTDAAAAIALNVSKFTFKDKPSSDRNNKIIYFVITYPDGKKELKLWFMDSFLFSGGGWSTNPHFYYF